MNNYTIAILAVFFTTVFFISRNLYYKTYSDISKLISAIIILGMSLTLFSRTVTLALTLIFAMDGITSSEITQWIISIGILIISIILIGAGECLLQKRYLDME